MAEKTGIDPKAIADALKQMAPEDLRALLAGAGVVPTTMGMTPEHLQVLMGTMTKVSADAQRQALISQRRENPNYPEKSVFFPEGVFENDGTPKRPKQKFTVPTFFQSVRLAGELETEEEIELCNRFTESKTAREGMWTADLIGEGRHRRLAIRIAPEGHKLGINDLAVLPPFTMILRELLDGPAAVNTESLHKTIADMQQRIKELEGKPLVGAVA